MMRCLSLLPALVIVGTEGKAHSYNELSDPRVSARQEDSLNVHSTSQASD